MNHEPLRYAHDEGHTDICFSTDGSKFITCGADGDMRIWSTDSSEDPTHSCIGEWSLSVREKNNNLYIATSDNDVQILTFPNGEKNGVLDRFVAPINQIYLSRNSEHIALAGEDMEVKVYDFSSSQTKTFDGLNGPCLSVAMTSRFVAASSGDGNLRVWDLHTKELKKEISCFPKVNSFVNAQLLCRVDFSPNGELLAYPEKDTVVITDINFSQVDTLKTNEVTNHYSIVQFSPCGKFLVATTDKGDFVIFSVGIKMVRRVSQHPNGTAICGLMWNPAGNDQIVYTDVQGQLGVATECTVVKSSDTELFTENEVDFGDIQFESDDDDNENAVSVEKLKKEVMGDPEPELNFEEVSVHTPRPKTPEVPLQAPFMPTSSPEHLNPRYLCWNEVGIIRCYGGLGDEDSGKSVEIEFHNAAFHNSMMLQNFQDYTMGAVSTSAVVVANSKQVYTIPLSASTKEWVLKLEDSPEDVVLVATSENLICFATSNYLVRICSIFGTQRGVVSIPGPLVTMTCYQNFILVAYHSSGVRQNDQCVSFKLIKVSGLRVESWDLGGALGPETTLYWVGFTDLGTPAMMDSAGMLKFYPLTQKIWIPVCDTVRHMKNPTDCFFITSIAESSQTAFGIKCRASAYPSFTPTPTLSEIILEPPFAEASTEKSQLESNLFAWSNMKVLDSERKFSETGLKAFALACKHNLDQRAVELMEILSNPQLLSLGTKYAVRMNKKMMAEKLMEMASKLLADDESSFPAVTATPPLNANRKLSLSSIKRAQRNRQIVKETVEVLQDSQTSISSVNITVDESFEEAKNPFFKNNKEDQAANPLSLVNKYAGVEYESKENKKNDGEKRKQPDSSEVEERKEKQRKLDRFMISKRV